jgi:serine/threonine protein kinase
MKEVINKNKWLNPITIVEESCRSVSIECKDLIKRMLNPEIKDRPTAEECLNHEWFKCNR